LEGSESAGERRSLKKPKSNKKTAFASSLQSFFDLGQGIRVSRAEFALPNRPTKGIAAVGWRRARARSFS
jgi:hypothetical protein